MPDPLGPWDLAWPPLLAGMALAYLVGSIPFGLILTRIAGLGDIRAIGSGNIGATNVLRTGNKKLALATLILDGGKGAVAVAVAWRFGPDMAVMAAVGCMIGHCFPVWLKFKGGKGVATALGIWLTLVPVVGAAACAIWLITAFTTKYSSLSALLAVALAPAIAWYAAGLQFAEVGAAIAVLVWIRHHENIRRLLNGTESKIKLGGSKRAEPSS